MADVNDLADQLTGLFKQSLQDVYGKFTAADQQNLVDYGKSIAECAIERRASDDPARQAALDQQIGGFTGAINLMADRYLLLAAHEAEKTALAALKIAAEWGLKILIAAIK